MKKATIIENLKTISSKAERPEVRVFLNVTIKILEMSPRRIEGFISLIQGFSDSQVHKASSERKGIQYRKKRKTQKV